MKKEKDNKSKDKQVEAEISENPYFFSLL